MIAHQDPTFGHLISRITTILHSRTQDLHSQSVGEQVVQGIGNNNV